MEINGVEHNINDKTKYYEIEFVRNTTITPVINVTYHDVLDAMTRAFYNNELSYVFNDNKSEVYDVDAVSVKIIEVNANTYDYCNISNVVLIERISNGKYTKNVKRYINSNKFIVETSYSNSDVIEISEYDKEHKTITKTKDNRVETYQMSEYEVITEHSFGSLKNLKELFTYDTSYNQLLSESTFDANLISYTYDTFGRVIEVGDYSNIIENTFVDNNLTLLTVNGNDISYGYTDDLLTTVTKGDVTYTYEYDEKNRVTKVLENGYTLVEYVYVDNITGNDAISSTVSKRVYTTENLYYEIKESYDKYNKLLKVERIFNNTTTVLKTCTYKSEVTEDLNVQVKYCGSTTLTAETKDSITYNYDYEEGQLKTVRKDNSEDPYLEYVYDKFGRVIEVIQDEGFKQKYTYVSENDPENIISKITSYVNLFEIGNVSYSYDNYGRLDQKIINNGSFEIKYIYIYSNAGNGRLTNKVSSVREYKNGTLVLRTALEYDSNNNITKITENDVVKHRYQYDSHNRLHIAYNQSTATEYLYDYNGNILSKKKYSLTSSGTLGTCTSIINYGYSTTRKNQLVSYNGSAITRNYMGAPSMIGDYTATYSYSKLTGLSKGNVKQGTQTYTYTYNSEGVRTQKKYVFTPGRQALASYEKSRVTDYTLTGSRIDSEKMVVNFNDNSSSTTIFIYKYIGNELIGFTYVKDGVSTDYFYEKNIFGDIIKIYNSSGTVVGSYAYDEYGNCTVTGSTNDSIAYSNHFRYRGYYYDDEMGYYYCNARYYNPEWCRWISPDSIEYLDPSSINGLNLYAYCGNNPVMYSDPSGHMPEWAMWLVGGVLLAGSIALTIATWGAASGTILASVKAIAIGATISGITSAAIGTVAGGISYENGVASWDWSGAAEGFMWGSITGVISGAAGSALSNVGSGLAAYGKLGKLGYAGIQGLINSGIAGGLTAGQGLITGSFSLDSVGLSAVFGFAGGAIGITKWGEGVRNIIVGAGLGLGESSIGEIIEWWQSRQQTNMAYLRFAY